MYIKVKVTPSAKKELFTKISDDLFNISVKEKPERNLANKRIVELLANFFAIPTGKIRLISGHQSKSKIFSINK